ncbi:adenylosuccinate synthase [Amycolatopsis anabasis]|uniref:adenylosuccinate synthase n=1 Tax=Amycolatopsis anabasis TaxID=1840409 RepID=UPI00131A77F5|nr:adenylosuccinate synthase [Amycolatopsis anabasis]
MGSIDVPGRQLDVRAIRRLRLDGRQQYLRTILELAGAPGADQAITWVGDLQQGDGGKGAMTDRLAAVHQLVVRAQGGDNAGHTTVFEDDTGRQVVFRNHILPSGMRHPGRIGILGNGVLINPERLSREFEAIAEQVPDALDRLLISGRAHLVLPLHREVDERQEHDKFGRTVEIGTTQRGIGPANISKINRVGVRVWDLRDPHRVEQRIRDNVQFFALPEAKVRENVDWLLAYRDLLLARAVDSVPLINAAANAGYSILFEGAQGPLIDPEHGIYPYVTTSPTAFYSVASGSGLEPGRVNHRIGVLKAYQTMVGNGAFVTEDLSPLGARIREVGNEFGTTTARERRCGWLDLVQARWAAELNRYTSVVLTKLDVLDTFEQIGVCVAYEHNGNLVTDFQPEHEFLSACTPVYRFFPGWLRDTRGLTRYADLPPQAREFIDFIEDYLDTPVGAATKGPRDTDMLMKPASEIAGILVETPGLVKR